MLSIHTCTLVSLTVLWSCWDPHEVRGWQSIGWYLRYGAPILGNIGKGDPGN